MKDAISAVANVDDYSGSARLLAATTLRGGHDLTVFFTLAQLSGDLFLGRMFQSHPCVNTNKLGDNGQP